MGSNKSQMSAINENNRIDESGIINKEERFVISFCLIQYLGEYYFLKNSGH